ncbi:aromatic amino acid transport family protein, partial [Xenorhabdus sp. IM139775]|uniref:aromatic amino acid transport family protein n=1 Tax=Xenorhabdus sp. IM139775 TaxID=3025876 RepID=UPI0023589FE5
MSDIAIVRRTPSMWWGAIIICGTVVGAGMFTLPIVMAGAWYGLSVLILIISWACMLITGLMFQSVSRHYPINSGYDTITRNLLGNVWAEVNGLSIFFVLGILTYAYISASGPVYQHSLNSAGCDISSAGAKILLTVCIAAIVWVGTSGIGRLMSILLVVKISLLITVFGGLLTTINVGYILNESDYAQSYWPYMLGVIPFCLASFGYHGNISGLINYYSGDQQRIRKSLFIGTAMALVIYLFWITATMGNIPRIEFPLIIKYGGDIATLMQALNGHIKISHLTMMLTLFSHVAVLCSFLGVTAGLVDFISRV